MTPSELSPEVLAELAKLRDIRMTDPVGLWPLAAGWWGLLGFTALTLIVIGIVEFRRRGTVRYLALAELASLRDRLEKDSDPHAIGVDLAVLLRRVALSTDKRATLRSQSDDDWARELSSGEAGLSSESANFLSQAPYVPNGRTNDASRLLPIFTESEHWIRRHA